MKNLKFLIAAGLLTVSFNVPASIVDATDDKSSNHNNMYSSFDNKDHNEKKEHKKKKNRDRKHNEEMSKLFDLESHYWDTHEFEKHKFKTKHLVKFDDHHDHHNDLSAVPIPPAVWLFGSGLIGLVAVARRK